MDLRDVNQNLPGPDGQGCVLIIGGAPRLGACLPKTPNRQRGDMKTANTAPAWFLVLPAFTLERKVQGGRLGSFRGNSFYYAQELFCPSHLELRMHF